MDEFNWWIEYVIKFRGAKHLKSHATNLSLFEYLMLDLILVNVIALMMFISGIHYIIKKLRPNTKSIDNKKKTR